MRSHRKLDLKELAMANSACGQKTDSILKFDAISVGGSMTTKSSCPADA